MIKKAISQAIKNQGWLSIEYRNKSEEITNYWIAIRDIEISTKRFFVSAFNMSKMSESTSGIIDTYIYYDQIKKAHFLKNTTYEQNPKLIEKIENNLDELKWLEYDSYSENIIDYIYECIVHEETPYQKETTLVRKIDQDTLEKIKEKEKYFLEIGQVYDLVSKIEQLSKQEEQHTYENVTLAMNLLSIHSRRNGLFVVAYKELNFNPLERSLILDSEIKFNYTFASNDDLKYKHHLKNYLDIETEYFIDLFVENPTEAKKMLEPEVHKHHESLDDTPYIMDLVRTHYAHIEKEFDAIKLRKKNNQLSTPLKSFFGNMTGSFLRGRTRSVDVVTLDDKVNIDQLRVIYNALTKPITFVQGPPGTGKTHTIINSLISAFFNKDTVLVSSNNNKPINDIYEKITHFKNEGKNVYLPFIRLGNREETLKSLNYIHKILPIIEKHKVFEEKLDLHAKTSAEDMKRINQILSDYESKIELEEELETLKAMKKNLNLDLRGLVIEDLIYKKEKALNQIEFFHDDDIRKFIKKADKGFYTWLFFTGIMHYKRIFEPKNEQFLNILKIENEDDKIKEFNSYIKDDKNFQNFQRIFPVILTTNQSAFRLGAQEESFDLVIIDEAGQSSIGYSLFPISRAKRLLLVGDQKQLKPVITMASENNKALMKKYQISESYNYIENSILLTMQKVDIISKFVLLRYHYRSRTEIIDFSNQKYYNSQLKLTYNQTFKDHALEFINVDTQQTSKPNERNVSVLEINHIIEDIKKKEYKNVGIITPFRNQANLIETILDDEKISNVTVGTIHTFQGDEKDVIYLSSALSTHTFDKTFDWVKNNQELINVATTRAKNKFILVSDEKEILKRSADKNDFYELYAYIKENGKEVKITPSKQDYFINGANFKSYDTKKEAEFFKTINHLLTTADRYVLESKVRIASILNKFISNEKYDYGLKGEFDLVIFKKIGSEKIPVVVIELDGNEHYTDDKVIKRDKMKKDICRDNNIELIRIDNKYSRRYMYIKEILHEIIF